MRSAWFWSGRSRTVAPMARVVSNGGAFVFAAWMIFSLAACGGSEPSAPARELTVTTESGLVRGFERDGVFSYRGIPYAAPPIGELRWKPPSEVVSWSGTLDAVEPPSPCPQELLAGLPVPGFAPSEDCLHLNVDAPAQGSRLPVMVWIHGGGFTLGEGLQTDGGTSGDRIARRADVVVVSMNYRLGPLGFAAHAGLTAESLDAASGNYGLMDQTAALRWVQRNIEAFGGDPGNITIFGESAGAFSVCSHLASPRSTGLFHKAILMSGSCERPWPTLTAAEAQGERLAQALGCETERDVVACMRGRSAQEVLAALPPAPNFGFNPSEGETGYWGPILDGAFFLEQPATSFESGAFNRVPVIVGFTREEARLFTWLGELADPPLEVTAESYESLVARLVGGDPALAARAVAEYPLGDYSEPAVALAAVATDTVFRCPAKSEAAKLSEFVPTYLYQFEYPNGHSQLEVALPFIGAELPSYDLAAFHGADIPYVFGYDPLLEIDFETFSTILEPWAAGSADEALWMNVLGYFSRFAATADPNDAQSVRWPEYDAGTDSYLALDESISANVDAAPQCAFWAREDYLQPELGSD